MTEDVVRGAAIVPYDFLVFFRNLRYGHRQAAGIRPQENVNLIRSQKLEYVLPGKADLTAIVIPNQPDRPFLPVPHGNAALSIYVRLPEANTLERLLAQRAELAGQGNGQPDRNFCLVAHTLTRGDLSVQVVQHPVDDNPGNRDAEPERERLPRRFNERSPDAVQTRRRS